MRTTLTLDDDLASILLRETKRKGLSFKEMVNTTLRRGIAQEQLAPPHKKVLTRPHDFGFQPGIDLYKLNQLSDELEAGAWAQKNRPHP